MGIMFLPEIYNLCVSFKEWIEDGPRGGKKKKRIRRNTHVMLPDTCQPI